MTTSDETTRARCLRMASQYTSKDRNSAYGDPEDNFSNIAEVWNAQGVRIDGRALVAADVALLMVGMKLARLRFNPGHEDSWVDVAGYAACGMDVAMREKPEDAFKPPLALVRESGWVSGMYRCATPNSHGAHTYGPDKHGWCDGYI